MKRRESEAALKTGLTQGLLACAKIGGPNEEVKARTKT